MPLYNWYNHLSQEGKKYGYLVNGSKSWLIVKSDVLADEAKRVFGEEVNITTEGQRHFGAVIGSQQRSILSGKGPWTERRTRSTIWDNKEPASCSLHCCHEGLQIQLYLFHAKIESFEYYVDPIQEAIDDLLHPAQWLFSQTEPLPRDLRQLVTLSPAQGGLGGPDLRF